MALSLRTLALASDLHCVQEAGGWTARSLAAHQGKHCSSIQRVSVQCSVARERFLPVAAARVWNGLLSGTITADDLKDDSILTTNSFHIY